MRYEKRRPGRVLGQMPRQLNWRLASLIFVAAILVFLVAAALTKGDSAEPPTPFMRLKNVARLSTVDLQLSTVVKVINPRGFAGDEVLVYGICGRVVAGVDLSKLEEKDIQVDGLNVRIKLPLAEIFTLDPRLEDSIPQVTSKPAGTERTVKIASVCEHTFRWDKPPLLSRTSGLIAEAERQALQAFKKSAEDNGILALAQTEAEEQLKSLLLLAGYQNVEFEAKAIQIRPETP